MVHFVQSHLGVGLRKSTITSLQMFRMAMRSRNSLRINSSPGTPNFGEGRKETVLDFDLTIWHFEYLSPNVKPKMHPESKAIT